MSCAQARCRLLTPKWKAYHTSNKEFAMCEKYCREQRELLRAIEDLAQQEREMYELDNRKDQIMTVCKVALANPGMWTRDVRRVGTYEILTRGKRG
jgi:hypothetical protein